MHLRVEHFVLCIFIGPKSDHCLPLALTDSLTPLLPTSSKLLEHCIFERFAELKDKGFTFSNEIRRAKLLDHPYNYTAPEHKCCFAVKFQTWKLLIWICEMVYTSASFDVSEFNWEGHCLNHQTLFSKFRIREPYQIPHSSIHIFTMSCKAEFISRFQVR